MRISRMLTSAVCCLLLGVITAVSEAGTPWNEEQRWISEMLDPARYNVATRPVDNITDTVEVTVEMSVFSISKLDSKNQELTAATSSHMGWEDKRLSWNSSKYSGMESIVVKANMVWYPNILILNAIGGTSTLIPSDIEVLITSRGELFVSASRVHSTQCYLQQQLFPFDAHDCTIILGTRGAPSDVISLAASPQIHNKDYRGTTANWELKTVSLVEGYSSGCIKHIIALDDEDECQRSSQLSVILCLQRVPKYYIYTVMVPITMLTVMASCVFWLPPECGEKLSFSVSVFFGFVIFQLVVQDDLAVAGIDRPSVLIRYELFNFALAGVAVVESAISLKLRNKADTPEARDLDTTETTSRRRDNKSQNNEDSPRKFWKFKDSVPRNWKKIASYFDCISFVLFWIAYIVFSIILLVEVLHDAGCRDN